MHSGCPIECLGIDHVVLRIREVERSLEFYTEVLGLRLERIIEDLGIYQVRCGRNLIDLCTVKDGEVLSEPAASGMDHLCLMINGDVDALVEFVKSRDIPITFGPVELYGATGYGTSIYILDPDGHTIELKTDRPQWAVRTTGKESMAGLTRPGGAAPPRREGNSK